MAIFPINGFLGTGATFEADLNLIVQVVMGVALIAGALLAKRKRYAAHGICQTTVLLLNLGMIGLVMWTSFQRQVRPALPEGLHRWYFVAATIHALLGGTAELLGLYIVVVAGTRVPSAVAALQRLEEVDARGADALVDCCPHRCWDLLRLVYSSVPVVLGWRGVTLNRWSEDRTQTLNPPIFLCLGNISQVAEL